MRLIDADALKAYIDAQKGRPFIGCTVGEALKIMTDEQPTIDAVQVIRCKDCEYAKLIDKEDGWYECWHDKRVMHSDGYCSWAERMDKDETD